MDTFRIQRKELSPYNADLIIMIKEQAEHMENLMSQVKSREMSLALTNLEQSVMWASKAIALNDEAKVGMGEKD